MTVDEIKAKAIELNWSREQLREALNGIDTEVVQHTAEELTPNEMAAVAGGVDVRSCPHIHVTRKTGYDMEFSSSNDDDHSPNFVTIYNYKCEDCGWEWGSRDQNTWKPNNMHCYR